ncbi:cysteine peptidase family C39 domain-containing protein [Azospirillum doebereinerae]|uniref:cysteine peptidase family C39 domain-containing protein n=1 Tax=Azospirillum doebereinerae TaxID=92933 RepID=UPI00384CB0B0
MSSTRTLKQPARFFNARFFNALGGTGRVATPEIRQGETAECGLAALAILLAHHGRPVTLEQLRAEAGSTRLGLTARTLLHLARRHGMEARAFRKEPEELAALGFPLIAHSRFIHYLVVEGVTRRDVLVNDPATGPRSIPWEEFAENFTGIAITLRPVAPTVPRSGRGRFLRALVRHLTPPPRRSPRHLRHGRARRRRDGRRGAGGGGAGGRAAGGGAGPPRRAGGAAGNRVGARPADRDAGRAAGGGHRRPRARPASPSLPRMVRPPVGRPDRGGPHDRLRVPGVARRRAAAGRSAADAGAAGGGGAGDRRNGGARAGRHRFARRAGAGDGPGPAGRHRRPPGTGGAGAGPARRRHAPRPRHPPDWRTRRGAVRSARRPPRRRNRHDAAGRRRARPARRVPPRAGGGRVGAGPRAGLAGDDGRSRVGRRRRGSGGPVHRAASPARSTATGGFRNWNP